MKSKQINLHEIIENSLINLNVESTKHKIKEEMYKNFESSPANIHRTKCNTSTAHPKNYFQNNIIYVSSSSSKDKSNKMDKSSEKINLAQNINEDNQKFFSHFSFKSFSKVLIDNIVQSREKIVEKKKSLSEQISEFFIDH